MHPGTQGLLDHQALLLHTTAAPLRLPHVKHWWQRALAQMRCTTGEPARAGGRLPCQAGCLPRLKHCCIHAAAS